MAFVKRTTIIGDRPENEIEENWLVFERDVSHLVEENQPVLNNGGLAVQIAFRVSEYEQDGKPNIVKLHQSNLNVFFPTEKETYLGFLVQGPYRTTPARDNISTTDEFNISLAEETGELVVEALCWLRDRDWLTVNVLNTMPLTYTELEYRYDHNSGRYGNFPTERNRYKHTLFAPMQKRVKQALVGEALIPAFGGGYVAAKDARIAGSEALRDLLEAPQLQQLLDFSDQTRWLTNKITEGGKTQDLWRYLTTILDVEVIDTVKFVRRINQDFIRNQSDEWIRRFYEFVSGFGKNTENIRVLKTKPIIRLDNDTHVAPYKNWWDDKPQVYLPTEHKSQFPTVKRAVCNSDKSLEFLEKLVLKEPDIVDEVLKLILPKYNGELDIDEAGNEHQQDIARIVQALGVDSQERKRELVTALKATPFLWATNAIGDSEFRKPDDIIYFRNQTLEMYFEGNPDGWFISSEYEQYSDDLEQLSIFAGVVYWLRKPNYFDHVKIESRRGRHVRGLNGFDPDFKYDELKFALNHPSLERSAFIWNTLLTPRKHLIGGEIESSTRQDFSFSKIEEQLSITGKLVCESAWLPDRNGRFVIPSELSLDDLPEDFRKDNDLANRLGMLSIDWDGIPESERQKFELTKNRSAEEIKEALELFDEKNEKQRETVESLDPDEYPSELEDVFDQPDILIPRPRPDLPDPPDLPDISPEDRLYADIDSEPDPEERYELRIKRIWQPKNPETRQFLEKEYEGRCQICDYTFEQRNRTYYFEAVHIVPRTRAKWVDDPRNAICLCANHSAQFRHGELSTPESDIREQIISSLEGQEHTVLIMLCGEPQLVRFSAKHMDEFRGLLRDI